MSLSLKEILNEVLGQSGFLQLDTFASASDPDAVQMVSFANRAAREYRTFFQWNKLRTSTSVTLVGGQTEYDLPADFDSYATETMWKGGGAREVVIPASDRYWTFIKAGNPGTSVNYYARIVGGQLAFTSVVDGDVINYDYVSKYAVTDSGGTPKERFTSDTDLFLLDDDTLILGTKAYWQLEKEMPAGMVAMKEFRQHMKRDIAADTPAKVIRTHCPPITGPVSEDYQW